jgi:hypothetical protein
MFVFWEVVNNSIVPECKKLPSRADGSFYSMEVKIFLSRAISALLRTHSYTSNSLQVGEK